MLTLLTPALEAFINLAERIISTEKSKRDDKRLVFKEIIEPLFVQLQPVAENYIEMFRKARQRVVESQDGELWTAIDEIRELREKMQLARISIRKMTIQMYDMYEDEKIRDFAERISMFFFASLQSRARSDELVEFFEEVIATRKDKSILAKYLDDALNELVRCWNRIGESYATAKIYCLSAPRLIKKSK